MSALEEETVDWGDVEATVGEVRKPGGGDDVISLGGAEELEEEVMGAPTGSAAPTAEAPAIPTGEPSIETKKTEEEQQSRPLPEGWKLQEARSGGIYYFNTLTGATTWNFPSEEAEGAKPKATGEERLGGIQIRGSARKEEEEVTPSRKREGASEPSTVTEDPPQKRRRSNTPEPQTQPKAETRSPPPPSAPADNVRRERLSPPGRAGNPGWGRRAEVSASSNGASGARYGRQGSEAVSRDAGGQAGEKPSLITAVQQKEVRDAAPPTGPRPREAEYRRRTEETDRSYSRSFNGGSDLAGPNPPPRGGDYSQQRTRNNDYPRSQRDDARQRVDGYPSSARPAGGLDDRRDRDRGYERRREASPERRQGEDADRRGSNGREEVARRVGSGREETDRRGNVGRETAARPAREQDRDRDEGREVRRDRERRDRDSGSERERPRGRDEARTASVEPSRATPVEQRSSQEGYGFKQPGYQTNSQRQGYGGQGYNYMDRSVGPRQGRPVDGPGNFDHHQPRGVGGYQQYGGGAAGYGQSPYPAAGQGYQRSNMPPFSPGDRHLRPFVPPEEKQKKWWNKNSGERKPVNEATADEGDARSSRPSPSTPLPAEPPRRTPVDREQELAEREAAIARKERQLGLK